LETGLRDYMCIPLTVESGPLDKFTTSKRPRSAIPGRHHNATTLQHRPRAARAPAILPAAVQSWVGWLHSHGMEKKAPPYVVGESFLPGACSSDCHELAMSMSLNTKGTFLRLRSLRIHSFVLQLLRFCEGFCGRRHHSSPYPCSGIPLRRVAWHHLQKSARR